MFLNKGKKISKCNSSNKQDKMLDQLLQPRYEEALPATIISQKQDQIQDFDMHIRNQFRNQQIFLS